MKLLKNEDFLYIVFDGEMDRAILRVDKTTKDLKWLNEANEDDWNELENCELVK